MNETAPLNRIIYLVIRWEAIQSLEILIQCLVCLTSGTLHAQWPFHEDILGQDTKSGSPLGRSWNTLSPTQ